MERDEIENYRKSMSEKSYEFETLRQEVAALNDEINQVGLRVESFELAKESVNAFKKSKSGDELVVPIGEGVFIKAKVDKNSTVLINVGSGVIVSKRLEDAESYVTERVDEADKLINTLNNNIAIFTQRLQVLEREIQEAMSVIRREEAVNIQKKKK